MPAPPRPLLLPTPREVALTGGTFEVPPGFANVIRVMAAGEHPIPHGRSQANLTLSKGEERGEAYSLVVGTDGVQIFGDSSTSLRHGLRTLDQLLRQYGARLPALRIADHPGFARRGVMLDVSRDKVPTMEQLRATIDLLASLKLNHLQLYTEHTFAYADHQEVWSDPPASPITPEEARELDHYAAARGVELAANQNCFGHLASWLRRPHYQHLAEIEGNNVWKFHQWDRRGPFSLCPTEPRAEAFVGDLLGQMLPCFSSPVVNIGCDETFDVGWGRSAAEVEKRARAGGAEARERARVELYFEFVRKIARICERHGKRPMMWADIALTRPDMLHLMPPGMIGLAWWYEPTDKFARWVEVLRDRGHEAWVCPGTSSWRTFTGRTTERRANIADAAEQGARAGASGFMVCDWGDMGHRQQWPITLAGLAHAAEAAWNPAAARAFDPRAASLHVLGDAPGRLGAWLDELGDCDLPIRRHAGVLNASALFNDMHPPVPGQLKGGQHEVAAPIEMWRDAAARLDALAASRPPIADALVDRELSHAVACARVAADHALAARDPSFRTANRTGLVERLRAIRAGHESLWLERNRPGGLPHATSHYDALIAGLSS